MAKPLLILTNVGELTAYGVKGIAIYPAKWGDNVRVVFALSILGNPFLIIAPPVPHYVCRTLDRVTAQVTKIILDAIGARYTSACYISVEKGETLDNVFKWVIEEGVLDCIGVECFNEDELERIRNLVLGGRK